MTKGTHQANKIGQQGQIAQTEAAELQGCKLAERVEVSNGHGNVRRVLSPQPGDIPRHINHCQ